MPRFGFKSEDQVSLIQVQKNAFILNWLKHEEEYPHFTEKIKPAFDKYFQVFKEFLQEDVNLQEIRVSLYELTYHNTVSVCDYWKGPCETPNIIPSFKIPDWGLETSPSTRLSSVPTLIHFPTICSCGLQSAVWSKLLKRWSRCCSSKFQQ